MEKRRSAGSFILQLFILLLGLSLLSLWLLGNMYARYTTQGTSGDSARVAAYVFYLQDGENSTVLNLNNIRKPGDKQTYTFTVTNKRDSQISEVAQEYSIKMEVNGSMPITCQLEKQADTQEDGTSGNTNLLTDKTSAIKISASEEYTQTYVLTAVWPEQYNDEKYANASATSAITLTVDASQLD